MSRSRLIIIYGSCFLLPLPYGLSPAIAVVILIKLLFEKDTSEKTIEEGKKDRGCAIGYLISVILFPWLVFQMPKILPLNFDTILTVQCAFGNLQIMPSFWYSLLYIVPLLYFVLIRRIKPEPSLKNCGKIALFILLFLGPIFSSKIMNFNSVARFYREVSSDELLFLSIKSFYYNGLWEELFFRGLLLSLLLTRFGKKTAILLSAFIFSIYHFDVVTSLISSFNILNVGRFMNLFTLGLATGYIYVQTGNLIPCILYHAFSANSAMLLLYTAMKIL